MLILTNFMSALKAKERCKFWTMTLTTKSLSKYGFFIVHSNQKASRHTSEEDSFHHYQAHQNRHGTSLQCDLRKLSDHIVQQHELPAETV